MGENYAELSHEKGYFTAVMKREIDAPIDKVWSLLNEESHRVNWLAPA